MSGINDELREQIDVWQPINDFGIGLLPVDGWVFYYDETNNFRSFKFDPEKSAGYNVERALTHDFILGGIAFNPKTKPDPEQLMDRLGIQKSNELKAGSILKHKDFLEDIGLERVHSFLEWILDSGVTVHFTALNNLYWSIIDLIDEAIFTDAGRIMIPFHRQMKDQLFFFIMNHLDEMTHFLQRYGYPNLENENINPFFKAVSDFILENSYHDTPELFFLEAARQILKDLKNENEMMILSGRESGVLIGSYVWEYIGAIRDTPNAYHHFDHEIAIEKKMRE